MTRKLTITCLLCNKRKTLEVDAEKHDKWLAREMLVQEAFPELSADDRELIQSHICGECYDKLAYTE